MKILQLNVWMGKVEGNLKRFLEKHDFDVICMQEVMFSKDRELHLSRLCFDCSQIVKASKMPHVYFSPNWSSEIAGGTFELGNLILSKIPMITTENIFVSGEFKTKMVLGQKPGNNLNIQIVKLQNSFTIINHHGYWQPNPIGNDDTIRAFEKAAQIVRAQETPLVMCGDLNIIHESPAMRPLDFLRDLTYENNVKNTLSGLKFDGEVPCDHILVSSDVGVKDFIVYDDLVSDHSAIAAEVEVKNAA